MQPRVAENLVGWINYLLAVNGISFCWEGFIVYHWERPSSCNGYNIAWWWWNDDGTVIFTYEKSITSLEMHYHCAGTLSSYFTPVPESTKCFKRFRSANRHGPTWPAPTFNWMSIVRSNSINRSVLGKRPNRHSWKSATSRKANSFALSATAGQLTQLLPAVAIRAASAISRVSLSAFLYTTVHSFDKASHPQSLQCTDTWPSQRVPNFCLCSLNLSFGHLPDYPM